jgi:cytochrome c551/c552
MVRYFILYVLGIACFASSCNYQNEEELFPSTDCETEAMSLATDITPILNNYGCLSCHSTVNNQGSVALEDYNDLKKWADNGILLKSMQHDGALAMPQNQAKMNACDIEKVAAWIIDGASNN